MRRGTLDDVMTFWRTPWSKGLREACELIGDDPPLAGCPLKNKLAPWWIRPFCLQQWVTQAVVARQAWLKEHPSVSSECFGKDSEPEWTSWQKVRWTFAEPRYLRLMPEEVLLTCVLCELERLLRILLESPWMVWGQGRGRRRC